MHLLNCGNSKEMFDKLITIYGKDTEQILQEFFNYSFHKGSDISTHVGILENLAFRLNVLNQQIDDNMLISKILTTCLANIGISPVPGISHYLQRKR